MKIIGRKEEISVMRSYLNDEKSHLLAVIGGLWMFGGVHTGNLGLIGETQSDRWLYNIEYNPTHRKGIYTYNNRTKYLCDQLSGISGKQAVNATRVHRRTGIKEGQSRRHQKDQSGWRQDKRSIRLIQDFPPWFRTGSNGVIADPYITYS